MCELPEGLEIVVKEGRWYAFGTLTPRNAELYRILSEMGGVNESVSDGVYEFNIEILHNLDAVATLEPK